MLCAPLLKLATERSWSGSGGSAQTCYMGTRLTVVTTSQHLMVQTDTGNVIVVPVPAVKKLPAHVAPLQGQNVQAITASEHYMAAITKQGHLWIHGLGSASPQSSETSAVFSAWDSAISTEEAYQIWMGWTLQATVVSWRDWLEIHLEAQEQYRKALFRWKHAQMSNVIVRWRRATSFVPSPRISKTSTSPSPPPSRHAVSKGALSSSAFR